MGTRAAGRSASGSESLVSAPPAARVLDAYDPALLDGIDTLVLDCDGVLWEGDKPIEGAREAIAELRRAGKQLLFVTNNSSKSRRAILAKFERMGVEARLEEVVGAAYAAAGWVAQRLPAGQKVFVVGESGIYDELEELGIPVGRGVGAAAECGTEEFEDLEVEAGVGAVVVGCDTAFTYRKLCYASVAVQAGALFVATNGDAADNIGGRLMPGAGACVRAVEEACGRAPDVVAGKPSAWLLELLQDQYAMAPARTAFVGDRLDTDILLGARCDAALTVLTLTGVATLEDVERVEAAAGGGGHEGNGAGAALPHVVLPSIRMLVGV